MYSILKKAITLTGILFILVSCVSPGANPSNSPEDQRQRRDQAVDELDRNIGN
ncbi:hypothetical Protein YC6258_04351 [Gynuella sunshinyii YC6258]|uniref:Lipoprotein n=1 Tax=Gynuella sunshinyii YC6258 TaxID=1445510 RepID=A0A0C5VSR6_9GAMM|nr:hypothetical Protein YC6258_04351 [Gynuella sunshinyii YC6258]